MIESCTFCGASHSRENIHFFKGNTYANTAFRHELFSANTAANGSGTKTSITTKDRPSAQIVLADIFQYSGHVGESSMRMRPVTLMMMKIILTVKLL